MRKQLIFPSVLLTIGLLFIIVSLFLFIWPKNSQGAPELISPLVSEPGVETIFKNNIYEQIKKEKTTDSYPPNEYFPQNSSPETTIDLNLSAKAYAVMDRDSRQLLLAKNQTSEKQIASLTKVMTAVVALDKEKLDREIVISKAAAQIGESVMGVSYGERYTLDELLNGLLMVSANDAAEAIAQSLGRGRYWFIEEMNKKAYGLGMKDTYFVNPTGLDEETAETSTFSTALDLLGLTNYALSKEKFAQIVAIKYETIPYKEDSHKQIFLDNLINFNLTYPGIKGVKTGNTDFAGQTLISYCEHQNRKIIVVLLDSQATRDDAVKIYRYIFEGRTDWP